MSSPQWSATTADRPSVCLTFDNGPTPGITEPVLDLLAEPNAPATFFAIARKLATPQGQLLGRRSSTPDTSWVATRGPTRCNSVSPPMPSSTANCREHV